MTATPGLEAALDMVISSGEAEGCPPKLGAAIRYAVFPGGARIRPRLCLAVAQACGEGDSRLAMSAAVAIELLHCASLVHDDLPCFDDASQRRGKASVHRAFDERLAVLTGDALIVLAFETLARELATAPERGASLLLTVARAAGAPTGICAGQAWECETRVALADYHRAKTGSLFEAATTAGALACGADLESWCTVGDRIGEAYQVADDLHDVASSRDDVGKPTGRDVALGRPSAVRQMGVHGAVRRLEYLVKEAVAAVPECPGAQVLKDMIVEQARSFVPKRLARRAAA